MSIHYNKMEMRFKIEELSVTTFTELEEMAARQNYDVVVDGDNQQIRLLK